MRKRYVLRNDALKAILSVAQEIGQVTVAFKEIEDIDNLHAKPVWAVDITASPDIFGVIGAEFRKLGLQSCPFCPSERVTYGDLSPDGKEEPATYFVRIAQCDECYRTWDEFFSIDMLYYLKD